MSTEYRSNDLPGHDVYDSLAEIVNVLVRWRGGRYPADLPPRIEQREVGPWIDVPADVLVSVGGTEGATDG